MQKAGGIYSSLRGRREHYMIMIMGRYNVFIYYMIYKLYG